MLSRKPAGAFLSEKLRRLDFCRCAPDRRQAAKCAKMAWSARGSRRLAKAGTRRSWCFTALAVA
jgi:hypothetical protein